MKLIANSRKVILASLTVVMVYIIYQGPAMDMIHVEKGDIKEAMSMVIQPLARVYHEKENELSEEEKNDILCLFNNQVPKYAAHNMDAVLANTYGNWYPHEILPDPTTYRSYIEFPLKSAEEFGSCWPDYYDYLQKLTRDSSYMQVPFLYVLFCTGIVFWEMMFLLMCIIERRDYEKIVVMIPFLALWATIMLGPVALLRYTYPLMAGMPLLGCIIYKKTDTVVRESRREGESLVMT